MREFTDRMHKRAAESPYPATARFYRALAERQGLAVDRSPASDKKSAEDEAGTP